jgi:hypothetical protein
MENFTIHGQPVESLFDSLGNIAAVYDTLSELFEKNKRLSLPLGSTGVRLRFLDPKEQNSHFALKLKKYIDDIDLISLAKALEIKISENHFVLEDRVIESDEKKIHAYVASTEVQKKAEAIVLSKTNKKLYDIVTILPEEAKAAISKRIHELLKTTAAESFGAEKEKSQNKE